MRNFAWPLSMYEKLENYVKTRTIFNNITDLNILAIRHSLGDYSGY